MSVWEAETAAERRVLVEDLIEAVNVHPDHLQVRVVGAPPLLVTLAEVGLRDPGTRTCVPEGDSSTCDTRSDLRVRRLTRTLANLRVQCTPLAAALASLAASATTVGRPPSPGARELGTRR